MLSLVDWGHLLQGGKGWKFVQREIWQRAAASSRKGFGDSILLARQGNLLPVGSGSWQNCAVGSAACESLGKETGTPGHVLAVWALRMRCMWCWTLGVPLAGPGHQALLEDQAVPGREPPPQKHFILMILRYPLLALSFPQFRSAQIRPCKAWLSFLWLLQLSSPWTCKPNSLHSCWRKLASHWTNVSELCQLYCTVNFSVAKLLSDVQW